MYREWKDSEIRLRVAITRQFTAGLQNAMVIIRTTKITYERDSVHLRYFSKNAFWKMIDSLSFDHLSFIVDYISNYLLWCYQKLNLIQLSGSKKIPCYILKPGTISSFLVDSILPNYNCFAYKVCESESALEISQNTRT